MFPRPDADADEKQKQAEWDTRKWKKWIAELGQAVYSGKINKNTANALYITLSNVMIGNYPTIWPERLPRIGDIEISSGEVEVLMYVDVCKKCDKSPVITVIKAYGITRRTYDYWRRDFGDHPMLSQGNLSFLSELENGPEMVRQRMLAMAEAFRHRKAKR